MSGSLSSLAGKVSGVVRRAKEDGSLGRVQAKVLVARPDYSQHSLSVSLEQEVREHWDPIRLGEVIGEAVESLEGSFEDAVRELAEPLRLTEEELAELRGKLRQFLHTVGRNVANGDAKPDLDWLCARFVEEIRGGELDWEGQVWLKNVLVEGDLPIEIADGVILRSPVSEDFAFEAPAESPWQGRGMQDLLETPDSVLEIKRRSVRRPGHEARQIVNCLCLYDLGAVRWVRDRFVSNSLWQPFHTSWPHVSQVAGCSLTLSPGDAGRLREFVSRVAERVPVKPTGTHGDERLIGMKFYFRALLHATSDEERIFLAVASLEGILTAGVRQELAFRLSQRTAGLLSLSGMTATEVFREVRMAYRVRSAYAHGEPAPRIQVELSTLAKRMMSYARLVVLKALEVDSVVSREDLGRMLDGALLDAEILKSLRKRVAGGLWGVVRGVPG